MSSKTEGAVQVGSASSCHQGRTSATRGGVLWRATFAWVAPVIAKGYSRQLEESDLWSLDASEEAESLRQAFWDQEHGDIGGVLVPRLLLLALVRVALREVVLSGFFMALYTTAQLANPILLRELVNSISNGSFNGLYFAIGLLLSSLLSAFSSQLHFHFAFAAGRKTRALFITLVYQHTLTLSAAEMNDISSGEIINMMSADAQKFFEVSQFMHLFWAGPLQILVAVAFLLLVLGLPALAGIAVLFLIGPLNWIMARVKRAVRAAHMPFMDARVRLCTEVLAGIRVVKLFSWEAPFMDKIRAVRESQLNYVFRELHLYALVTTVLIITTTTASMATFVTVGATSRPLSAGDAFSALAFFNVLKFPLMQISQALMLGAQVLVASDRLAKFLSSGSGARGSRSAACSEHAAAKHAGPTEVLPEPPASFVQLGVSATQDEQGGIDGIAALNGAQEERELLVQMTNASFSWHGHSLASHAGEQAAALRSVDLAIHLGELVAVVGPVGSGKSSLVTALLNELCLVDGSHKAFAGEIAFCSQSPWILNATVEENILFGLPFEEDRFRKALDACCLWSDLEQLHEREKTVIGERGVTLSGGQKARIALARAAYSRAKLVILDDPLSALDAHVGQKVFHRLLSPRTGLLRNSARVLVTHAVQHLSICDKVIVMYGGKLAYVGSFSQLDALHEAGGSRAGESLGAREGSAEQDADAMDFAGGKASLDKVLRTILNTTQAGQDALRGASSAASADDSEAAEPGRGEGDGGQTGRIANEHSSKPRTKPLMSRSFESSKLMTAEERRDGAVDAGVAHKYIVAAGGYRWVTFVLALLVVERLTYIASDWWLAVWTEAETGPPDSVFDLPSGSDHEGIRFYSIGYVIATLVNSVFVLLRCFAFMQGGGWAARSLFYSLAWRVLRCPLEFFETTPLGRITNRFSYDIEVVDDLLVQSLNGMVASLLWMLSAIAVMISVTPLASVLIVPVMVLFTLLHRYYRRSCVELQRLDSTSRSPIQSQFRATLDGLATLRAFQQTDRFLATSDVLVDQNNIAIFAFVSSNRWLGLRLELLGGLVTFAVSFAAWWARDTISPGLAGLAVLWSFNLTTSFNYFVTQSTQAEAKMTSVERVTQYAELPEEPDLATKGSVPPPTWPSKGGVCFEGVVMQYRENLPPALKNLSFAIQPGEHVGICGRTGAGKSSLSVAMFRLRELTAGSIKIDGVDLAHLGLADVRGRALTIIPQDPTLFSGTVRFNIDPFGQFSDTLVLEAIDRACLTSDVQSLGGMDAQVGESGSNLSQGQRQLLCLARAILRRPKVLVCDEMTSSVDGATDALIQKTIRSTFRECTVITIAHRLHSIMDSNRVMVLHQGRVAEFDTPANLIARERGAFRALVDSNGPAMAAELLAMVGRNN